MIQFGKMIEMSFKINRKEKVNDKSGILRNTKKTDFTFLYLSTLMIVVS